MIAHKNAEIRRNIASKNKNDTKGSDKKPVSYYS